MFPKPKIEPQDIQVTNNLGKIAYVRELGKIWTVGQTQPIVEVPSPGSRKYNVLVRDRLQHFIFRLFKNPSADFTFQINDIMDAFPIIADTAVRKRLKYCADYIRATGKWILKPGINLPDDQDLRNVVLPEQICAYESCIAGQRRLEKAGLAKLYNIRDFPHVFAQVKNDTRRTNDFMLLEQEILRAPWSITGDFIEAITENKRMRVSGIGDPSQVGDMASFLRAPLRPEKAPAPKSKKRRVEEELDDTDVLSEEQYRQQLDKIFQKQLSLVTEENPEIDFSEDESSSEDESELDKLGQDIENLFDDNKEDDLASSIQKSIIEATKSNSSYVPKLNKKQQTEEEEREYERMMLELSLKKELAAQGVDPNSKEGQEKLKEKLQTDNSSYDTIWIKLTRREVNADGTSRQVGLTLKIQF